MKVFKDNRAVSHLRDYMRIVKFYNRIATALVTFESLWLNQWKSQIDQAKVGLRSPILATDLETGKVVVNVDERYDFIVIGGLCHYGDMGALRATKGRGTQRSGK